MIVRAYAWRVERPNPVGVRCLNGYAISTSAKGLNEVCWAQSSHEASNCTAEPTHDMHIDKHHLHTWCWLVHGTLCDTNAPGKPLQGSAACFCQREVANSSRPSSGLHGKQALPVQFNCSASLGCGESNWEPVS